MNHVPWNVLCYFPWKKDVAKLLVGSLVYLMWWHSVHVALLLEFLFFNSLSETPLFPSPWHHTKSSIIGVYDMFLLVLIRCSILVAPIESCPFHILKGRKCFLIIQVSPIGVHGKIPDYLTSPHSWVHGRCCSLVSSFFFGAWRWPQNLCQ